VCYAIGPLIASRKLSGLPPVGMTAACLAFAAVVYAPLAALTWTSALPSAKVLAAADRRCPERSVSESDGQGAESAARAAPLGPP
jgi:hypothetical protein